MPASIQAIVGTGQEPACSASYLGMQTVGQRYFSASSARLFVERLGRRIEANDQEDLEIFSASTIESARASAMQL
jgi:hypothetical protein